MLKYEMLDYETYLDGKHLADFEHLDDAKAFAYLRVDCKYAKDAVVVNKWTGEIVYHAYIKEKVVEE